MNAFVTALMWGGGLFVWAFIWVIVRKHMFRLRDETYLAIHQQSLNALQERNRLTEKTNEWLEHITKAVEDDTKAVEDDTKAVEDDDSSEDWKHGS